MKNLALLLTIKRFVPTYDINLYKIVAILCKLKCLRQFLTNAKVEQHPQGDHSIKVEYDD